MDAEDEAWSAVKSTIYFLRDSYVTAMRIRRKKLILFFSYFAKFSSDGLVACIVKTLATSAALTENTSVSEELQELIEKRKGSP